ncbi:MAG: hypothetical protein HY898_05350 [Deltaproteobacteria bacterium]|nr:hypothetical protein [Deltaproteobacteria bacterium]
MAGASPQRCSVRVDPGDAPQPWVDAAAKTRRAISIGDAEASDCGSIEVIVDGERAVVRFRTIDGRTAEREIGSPAELVPAVQALLVAGPVRPAEDGQDLSKVTVRPGVGTAATGSSMHALVGALATARIAAPGGYVSSGGSVFASVATSRWELGVVGDWDPIYGRVSGAVPSEFEMTSFGMAGQFAIRQPTRGPTLLFGGRAGIGGVSQQSNDVVNGQRTEAHLGALAGAVMPAAWMARFRVTILGEVVPGRVGRERTLGPGLPILPWWSVGLGVGMEVEVP